MAKVALILGESASGKTTAAMALPPAKTVIVNPGVKELTLFGSEDLYPELTEKNKAGRLINSSSITEIRQKLKFISDKRPEIKFAVIDDYQFTSLFTFVSRINEKSFEKFNEIAVQMVTFTMFLKNLRPDLTIFILNHIEEGTDVKGNPLLQAKTLGRFVKEKVTYEGLFTTVLVCDREEGDTEDEINYFMWTRGLGSVAKAPKGMFATAKIPSDLLYVAKAMYNFAKGIKE